MKRTRSIRRPLLEAGTGAGARALFWEAPLEPKPEEVMKNEQTDEEYEEIILEEEEEEEVLEVDEAVDPASEVPRKEKPSDVPQEKPQEKPSEVLQEKPQERPSEVPQEKPSDMFMSPKTPQEPKEKQTEGTEVKLGEEAEKEVREEREKEQAQRERAAAELEALRCESDYKSMWNPLSGVEPVDSDEDINATPKRVRKKPQKKRQEKPSDAPQEKPQEKPSEEAPQMKLQEKLSDLPQEKPGGAPQEEVPGDALSEEIEVPEEEEELRNKGTFQDKCVAQKSVCLQDTKPLAPLNDLLQLPTPEKNQVIESLLKAGSFVFGAVWNLLQFHLLLQCTLCRNSGTCVRS